MSLYLGMALFAEGPTDHLFLQPLLQRFVESLCLSRARGLVDIGPMIELHSPRRVKNEDRATRIREAARDAWGSFHLLFVHADGAGDPISAYRDRIEPARQLIRDDPDLGEASTRTVAVVPVRETEAWVQADGDALREAFGTGLTNHHLGLPSRTRGVEGIPDPKATLERTLFAVTGITSRRRKASDFFAAIGQSARFERLREVPSFLSLERELTVALLDIGYLKEGL